MSQPASTSRTADCLEALRWITIESRREFSPSIFWTIPRHSYPVVEARNIGRQLEKHGGLAGVRFAAKIEQLLKEIGEATWR
jgi:hypothetical protein